MTKRCTITVVEMRPVSHTVEWNDRSLLKLTNRKSRTMLRPHLGAKIGGDAVSSREFLQGAKKKTAIGDTWRHKLPELNRVLSGRWRESRFSNLHGNFDIWVEITVLFCVHAPSTLLTRVNTLLTVGSALVYYCWMNSQVSHVDFPNALVLPQSEYFTSAGESHPLWHGGRCLVERVALSRVCLARCWRVELAMGSEILGPRPAAR